MKYCGSFFLICLLCIPTWSIAQRSQNIRTSGMRVQVEELADSAIAYLYDGLKEAVITYKDGSTSNTSLNYSVLLDEFQMKTRRGIEALNFRDLEKLEVEGSIFIYLPEAGYLEVLNQGKHPLYHKRLVRVSTMPVRRGAYGGTDYTSAIDVAATYSTESTGDYNRQIYLDNPSGQEMDITLRYNEYFLIGKGETLMKVSNQRQLLRDFPEYRNELRDFIRKENTNFSNPRGLIKLVKYMGTL